MIKINVSTKNRPESDRIISNLLVSGVKSADFEIHFSTIVTNNPWKKQAAVISLIVIELVSGAPRPAALPEDSF